jgi:hypothetical protein
MSSSLRKILEAGREPTHPIFLDTAEEDVLSHVVDFDRPTKSRIPVDGSFDLASIGLRELRADRKNFIQVALAENHDRRSSVSV